jgi:hypothetical protein
MNERDEARAVLAELTCLRIDAEPEAKEVAALLRFAARAKAEALREADACARCHCDMLPPLELCEDCEHADDERAEAAHDAHNRGERVAAKLDGGTDGL